MDALLQILLPEIKQIPNLELEQRVFIWNGTGYPQEPVVYRWGPHVKLIASQIQQSLLRFLPDGYLTEQWVALDVNSEALDLIEAEINGEAVDWLGYSLDELIRLLLIRNDRWVLIFEPDYDRIDNVYRMQPEECISKLKAILERSGVREGFIALPDPE